MSGTGSEKETISEYITSLFAVEDHELLRIREGSQKNNLPPMRIKAEEGRFLQILVRLCGAEKALEIGTLGGYSAIWIVRGMKENGKLITLEKDLHHASVAQRHFEAAHVSDKIEIVVGDALTAFGELAKDSPFDFVFIDADKPDYPAYFEWSLDNIRLGGVITAHNVLRRGRVAGIGVPDKYTEEMQMFNKKVAQKSNIISTIYPGGDGILIAVKIA